MPISPFVRNKEDGFIQLRKDAEAHIELFSSLNDKIDKENYRIQMDVNMKEKKTEMNLCPFLQEFCLVPKDTESHRSHTTHFMVNRLKLQIHRRLFL